MKLDSLEIQEGKEKDYGVWGDNQKEFRLTIRWNEKNKVYECFKLYFDGENEEILFSSKKLTEIVIRTCNLANFYAKNLKGDLSKDEK